MSVESEILRIQQNIAAAYSAVAQKGGALPLIQNSENLATAIETMPTLSKHFDWFSPHMTSNNTPSPYVVTATSDYNSSGFIFPMWHAFDGNPNTFWHINDADAGKNTNYIQLDFGTYVIIDGIRMKPRPGFLTQFAHTFDLYSSEDGSNFTKFYTASALGDVVDGFYTYEFPMIIGKMFRLVATSASSNFNGAIAIGEIEFKKMQTQTVSAENAVPSKASTFSVSNEIQFIAATASAAEIKDI